MNEMKCPNCGVFLVKEGFKATGHTICRCTKCKAAFEILVTREPRIAPERGQG